MDLRTARVLRMQPGEPCIVCDACGMVRRVAKANGMAPAWFLDGKAPPGWLLERDEQRTDLCPTCRP